MALTADTPVEYEKPKRSDAFMIDPRALVVDWRKNISRQGIEPPVDENLIALAKSMLPRAANPDDLEGGTGQLQPILCRALPDRRLEVILGFRRLRAALYNIESGLCPDFKIRYLVSRMSDAEAALANLIENANREELKPIQIAHTVRQLTEDMGMEMEHVAARLKMSVTRLNQLLDLVLLPTAIQHSVANGETPVNAALELVKLPAPVQAEIFNAAKTSGEKVTVAKVKEVRRKVQEETGNGQHIARNLKQIKAFLEGRTGPADPARNFANYFLEYIKGKKTDDQFDKYFDRIFKETLEKEAVG